jgi:WD40 repeat protein
MLKDYIGKICPFCITRLVEGKEVVVCATCKTPHHKECWVYNLDKCATFGCKGKEILSLSYQFDTSKVIEESIIPTQIKNNTSKTMEIKPRRIPKRAVKPLNSKIQPKRHAKEIYFNNQLVPEAEFIIPEYVNEELIEPEPQKKKREFPFKKYKPTPLNEMKYEEIPKAPDFIPEYVHVDMREKPAPQKLIRPPILRLRPRNKFEEDSEKRQKHDPVPKPDPFIPDYVNQEMPVILKKKKNKYKITNIQIIPAPAPRTDYIPIVKPDFIIPDYVHSELEDYTESVNIISKNLLREKKCANCNKLVKIEQITCPYCLKSSSEKEAPNSTLRKITLNDINIITDQNYQPYAVLYANSQDIKSIDFSVDGKYLAFGSKDKSIKIFDVEYRECIKILNGHINSVNSVSYSADGNFLASAGLDRTVKIWDINSGECIKTITGNTMGFNYIIYSGDGGYILSCSGEGMVKVWSIQTGDCLRLFKADLNWINCAAFSLDGFSVVSGDSEGNIRLWDIASGENLKVIKPHFDSINSMFFTLDRKYLACASNDRTIKIISLDEWKIVKTLIGHQDSVTSIASSPDGRYIASASKDSTVKIWDLNIGVCVRSIKAHTGVINSVAYSPNGKFIATGGEEKIIKVWQLY